MFDFWSNSFHIWWMSNFIAIQVRFYPICFLFFPPLCPNCSAMTQRLHGKTKPPPARHTVLKCQILDTANGVQARTLVCFICGFTLCVSKNSRAKAGLERAVNHIIQHSLYISQLLPFCPLASDCCSKSPLYISCL